MVTLLASVGGIVTLLAGIHVGSDVIVTLLASTGGIVTLLA
jgi:hypothetical protein